MFIHVCERQNQHRWADAGAVILSGSFPAGAHPLVSDGTRREGVGDDNGRSDCCRVERLAAAIKEEEGEAQLLLDSISGSCSCGPTTSTTAPLHTQAARKTVGPMGPGMPAKAARRKEATAAAPLACQGSPHDLPVRHICFFRDLTAGARLKTFHHRRSFQRGSALCFLQWISNHIPPRPAEREGGGKGSARWERTNLVTETQGGQAGFDFGR